jgi:hypothetical protein
LEVLRPLFDREESPTLQEISDTLREVKQELSGAMVEGLARELNQGLTQEETLCPVRSAGPRSENCGIFPEQSRLVTERVF